MKIRLSELRQLIREELDQIFEGTKEDEESYQKIMAMISTSLGDTPETKKLGSELHLAFQTKKKDIPSTLSMKSVAQPTQAPTEPQGTKPGQTISMKSIR